ncbi:hypothetical protein [Cellulomonas sp. PhB143]|uniref:hypothetical protein n=1 Tax=Cellulomonas sp. PhB143 TaxID=2485186 RepID=UPI000F9B70D2|nr:hypothetical protein [Cellulomonas sp. PhB143]ROS73404.1 hypothetical protein EDF32_2672 [Cellulomonas sp. PhB143]
MTTPPSSAGAVLVLVHGRSEQGRDPAVLRAQWLDALRTGVAAAGADPALPALADDAVRLPYYADVLETAVRDEQAATASDAATSPVSEPDLATLLGPPERREFVLAVLDEARRVAGVGDAEVRVLLAGDGHAVPDGPPAAAAPAALAPATLATAGALAVPDAAWLLAVLRALDRAVPGIGGLGIALLARDVHLYLHDERARAAVDDVVAAALPTDGPAVVVAHSLGSVVAFELLRTHPDRGRWAVPLLVTIGCPIAIGAVRAARAPLAVPGAVTRWRNARDVRDVVALQPLTGAVATVDEVEVENPAPGHHAAVGYLATAEVAGPVAAALGARPTGARAAQPTRFS